MRAAIYARVSTEDQDCEIQLTNLRGYVKRWDWPAAAEYIEKLSGKERGKRPELDRLMSDARMKRIDVVLVWKMDRFGRFHARHAAERQGAGLSQGPVRLPHDEHRH
jgi:putative DNA-invertase from lambdoid prophage Rac